MLITLEHPIVRRSIFPLDELFGDINKMSKLVSVIKKCGKTIEADETLNAHVKPWSYAGDLFELFTEAFIKLHPVDNRVGITNLQPLIMTGKDDYGVDFVGIGMDGKPATVQSKSRSRGDLDLHANEDHISNFVANSWADQGVDQNTTTNLLIVTTAKNLSELTNEKMYANKVRTLGLPDLKSMLDNNFLFWDNFRAAL